jgi:SpoIIAA-like
MLERLPELPAGIDGLCASGKVTQEDYEKVVLPLLEEARREGRRIRFLYHFGPAFTGFTAEAAWEDARLGLQYLRLFERCAIVSDIGWIREASRITGAMLPCPVKVFGNEEWQEALAWLSAPVSASAVSYRLLPEAGVLIVEPKGALKAEDFDAVALAVDPWIEAHGALRGLVVHAREFPGWENFGSFLRHLRFVRDHHRKVRRVALAADGKVAELIPKLADHFVNAELKQFAYDQFENAIAWASARGEEGGEDPSEGRDAPQLANRTGSAA